MLSWNSAVSCYIEHYLVPLHISNALQIGLIACISTLCLNKRKSVCRIGFQFVVGSTKDLLW